MIALFLLCLSFSASAGPPLPTLDELMSPFEGFDTRSMQPIMALFQADQQGRLLLQKARRKMKLSSNRELIAIMDFCTSADLNGLPPRRGLFIQEIARYYRPKDRDTWLTTTMGGLERLEDPDNYPIVETKKYTTELFEHMEVAFLPRICLRRGLTIMQAYLVLYHELVHLVGLDPFDHLNLFSFTRFNMEDNYYRKRLAREGSELDAFIAQIGAYRRLRERYEIDAQLVLEGFLTEKGRLLVRDRPVFLDHLLDKGRYREVLDLELERQVVYQYNLAHSWWEGIEKVLSRLDDQLVEIDREIEKIDAAIPEVKRGGDRWATGPLRRRLLKLQTSRKENRRLYAGYIEEQKQHVRFMERVDARFPRE